MATISNHHEVLVHHQDYPKLKAPRKVVSSVHRRVAAILLRAVLVISCFSILQEV